jgi:hypothetical protein
MSNQNPKPIDPEAEAAAEFAETFGEVPKTANPPAPLGPGEAKEPPPTLTPIQKLEMAAALLGVEVNQLASAVLSGLARQGGQSAAAIPSAGPRPHIPKGIPNPNAPPMPAMDPRAGDKTPELVEWYRQWWPEEYENRYADRKTHLEDRRGGEARAFSSQKGFTVDDPLAFRTHAETEHGMKSEIPRHLIDPENPRVL